MSLPHHPWRDRLLARFDAQVMRDIGPEPDHALPPALRDTLMAWTHAGLGSGRAPWWRPQALPAVDQRVGVAVLVAADAEATLRACRRFARALDRNDELADRMARSRGAGLRLRLAVKWHELWWWRERHPQQPWDCGELRDAPEALRRFAPRRPTLLLAADLPPERLRELAALLQARGAACAHPVRLLCIVAEDSAAPPGAKRLAAGAPT